MLQLYEGEKPKNIVNGNIDTEEKWKRLNEIKDTYIQTLFGNKIIGPYISKELIKFMYKDIFNSEHKITVIVGHDSNIAALFSALNIKKYTLEKQYEMFPVGGKIFFQIWKDRESKKKKVKIEYIYQSTEQLRNLEQLSLKNSPMRTVLEMEGCPVDKNDFCSYEKFEKILKNAGKQKY